MTTVQTSNSQETAAQLDPLVMRLHFDPFADPVTAEVFNCETARKLYLLWRRGHIVSDRFTKHVLAVARKWESSLPTTIREASLLFPHVMEFPERDVLKFLESHWEYFTGARMVEFVVLSA